MHQKPLGGRAPPGPLGEPPEPLAAVKGLGRKKGGGEEGRGWRGKGEGMGREVGERDGRQEGTRRGPQFNKNDPPSSDGWLRACPRISRRLA